MEKKIIFRFLAILGIFAILIIMRVHFVEEPFERDEGGYGYMAWRFLNGEIMYKDYWDTKPPGIIFIYAFIIKLFGMNLIAVRVCSIFWGLIGCFLAYLIGEKMFDTKIGLLSMLFYAVFSGGPLIEGASANAEPFMIVFSMLGVYLFLLSESKWSKDVKVCGSNLVLRIVILFLAGVSFGFAFMIKQTAFDGLLAVFFYILIIKKKELKDLIFLSIGFIFAWIPVVFYLVKNDAFIDFFYASYLYNFPYIKKALGPIWFNRFKDNLLFISNENFLLWALGITGFFILWRNKFIRLWTLLCIFGVFLGGRFFPHYFIQLIPVLCILSGYCLSNLFSGIKTHGFWRKGANIFALVTILFLLFITFLSQYKFYFVFSPYEVCRAKYPGADFVLTEILGRKIGEITEPSDYIYVWGSEPEIYFYSKRRCPVRYINDYFMKDNPGFAETAKKEIVQGIELKKPKIIVAMSKPDIFPELNELLNKYYKKGELEGVTVFYER